MAPAFTRDFVAAGCAWRTEYMGALYIVSNIFLTYKAFQKSAAHCASLVILQPNNALYHHDCAISHLNAGLILEQQGEVAAAREEYLESLERAGSAAELNPQWLDLARDAESRVDRLKGNGP